ncbi:MAG: sensor histidine kinase [Paenibacillaceae bacterium]|nr:sensor histidine kinase [Paenibacillaceae bacterium]
MNAGLRAFHNMRFRWKLVLSYLVVILIPLLTLGLYSFHQSKLFLRMQAEQSLQATTLSMAENLNARLARYDEIVKSVVANPGFHRIFANRYLDLSVMSEDIRGMLEPYFATVINLNPEIEQMSVYSQGLPEFGSYMMDLERVREESWPEEAIAAKKTVWSFTPQSIELARAFPDLFVAKNTAVLYIRLNQAQVLGELGASNLERYGVVVADEKQRIVFANRNAPGETRPPAPERIAAQSDGMTDMDGMSYFVVRKPVALAGWTLTVYIPVDGMAADAGSIVKATVVVVTACLLALLVLVWIFSRTLLKPIRHLNKKMMQVENGDLQVVAFSTAKDEIGELTNRFGRMLNRINELIRETYQNRITQKEAELKALQSQINPHFLYNTLSIIHWKAVMRDAHDIGSIVNALSRFYRTALNKGSNVIPIRNEIDNIRSYLDIQLVMHDHSFDVSLAVDDRLYGFDMLNLVLQPIVENAIEHGIDLIAEGRGKLTIEGKLDGDTVVFDIADNGPGIEPALRDRLLTEHTEGYGLKNVHERIRLFFGEPYGITILSELGAGTRMRIRFPQYRHEPPEADWT